MWLCLLYGFDPYCEARKAMLKRAADPNDPVTLSHLVSLDGDNYGEFDVQNQLTDTVMIGDMEDDDDGC